MYRSHGPAVFLVLLLAGVLPNSASMQTPANRPYVTFTNPPPNESNVPRDAFVSADVTVPNGGINPATVTAQSVYLIRSSDNAIEIGRAHV